MHDGWFPWGWGGMGFGPLIWIVVLALVVWFAVSLVQRKGDDGNGAEPWRKSARDILDERFAKGEIDQEEYEKRRKTLNE